MNMKNNLRYTFLLLLLCGMAFTACEDDVTVGQEVDESQYENVTKLQGLLVDQSTNKNSSVIEMRGDVHSTDISFRLSKLPNKGVDVKITVDEAYAAEYNAAHNTTYEVYPAANVK